VILVLAQTTKKGEGDNLSPFLQFRRYSEE